MTPWIKEWISIVRELYPFEPGRVLEVGSRNVNGSPREHFKDALEYVGIDMQEGDGVDLVMNAADLLDTFNPESFDTIICCEMLEHDIDFQRTLSLIRMCLARTGHLIITTPTFGFPVHRFPKDYWRFGEDAYREVFFAGYDLLNLSHLDDFSGPKVTLAGLGIKP